jgi:glycine/D-amino acid oxidase-like deaminating enzyme
MNTQPYWFSETLPEFPSIAADLDVDVAIVGAGLTGITAAYLLKQAGARVVLLERGRCAMADTGHTTAHLSVVTDLRLHQVVKKFGRDAARAFWDAGRVAIDQIDATVRAENIACDFKWVPGYLHASLRDPENRQHREELELDARLGHELGFGSEMVSSVPYCEMPGVKFPHQAQFHPLKYLKALLAKIPGQGSHVFEHSAVTEFHDAPMSLTANGHRVRSRFTFIATHTPLMGNTGSFSALLFQTKLSLYTSYVLGAHLPLAACRKRSTGTCPILTITCGWIGSRPAITPFLAVKIARPARKRRPRRSFRVWNAR